jgi:hypothetical protein
MEGVQMTRIIIAVAVISVLISCGSSPSSPYVPGPGPDLLSPLQGDTVAGTDVQLMWDAVSGATRYYIGMSADSFMSDSIEVEALTAGMTLQPGLSGTYWWKVRASLSEGLSEWSETWSFYLLNPCL